jgi:hypothetical protein
MSLGFNKDGRELVSQILDFCSNGVSNIMKVSSPDRRVGMSNALAEAAIQLSERPMLVDSPTIVGLNQRRTQVLIVCNGDSDMEVFVKLFKRRIASPFYRPSVWNFHRLRHEMTVGFGGLIDIVIVDGCAFFTDGELAWLGQGRRIIMAQTGTKQLSRRCDMSPAMRIEARTTVLDWIRDDPGMREIKSYFYVGDDWFSPGDGWEAQEAARRGFDTEAIFLSCRARFSYRFLADTVLPLKLLERLRLFWCPHQHKELRKCTFKELTKEEDFMPLVNSTKREIAQKGDFIVHTKHGPQCVHDPLKPQFDWPQFPSQAVLMIKTSKV